MAASTERGWPLGSGAANGSAVLGELSSDPPVGRAKVCGKPAATMPDSRHRLVTDLPLLTVLLFRASNPPQRTLRPVLRVG